MAREMYLVGVDPEELKPDPKPEPPHTPKAKWENFWYHYKWATIGGICAVAVLIVLIVQMVQKDPPDYTMLLVTENAYSEQQLDAMETFLAQYGEDIDGDGKVEVQIINCFLGSSDRTTTYTGAQTLQVHLMAGDVMMFAFEPKYYEQFIGTDAVKELEGGFMETLDVPSGALAENGTVWNWKDDPRVTGDVLLSTFPKELYFGVRRTSGTAEKSSAMQQQVLALLRAAVTDRKTAQPTVSDAG